MTTIYQVRSEKSGLFSIYKNEQMIVYNLDSSDVKSFCMAQKDFAYIIASENSANFANKKPFDIYAPTLGKGPGRDLILAPHLHILKDMIEQDPKTTARDIERHLRGLGIKFAAITAVTNLARKHKIKLAA